MVGMKQNCYYLFNQIGTGCFPAAELVDVVRPAKALLELYTGINHNLTTVRTTVLNWGL